MCKLHKLSRICGLSHSPLILVSGVFFLHMGWIFLNQQPKKQKFHYKIHQIRPSHNFFHRDTRMTFGDTFHQLEACTENQVFLVVIKLEETL